MYTARDGQNPHSPKLTNFTKKVYDKEADVRGGSCCKELAIYTDGHKLFELVQYGTLLKLFCIKIRRKNYP
jgi:hypothetical protein